MKLKKALKIVGRSTKNEPVLRQCCNCREWLDEASEAVANARIRIKAVISHGLCEPCEDILYGDTQPE
jgi:hypothetical protein